MTRKGGGRESGAPPRGDVPPKTLRRDEDGTAAANLVARPLLQCPVGLDGAYHSCCQQVRALEAELESWKNLVVGKWESIVREAFRFEAVKRAEARVKELEDEVRIFRQNAPTLRADLRGEDRG